MQKLHFPRSSLEKGERRAPLEKGTSTFARGVGELPKLWSTSPQGQHAPYLGRLTVEHHRGQQLQQGPQFHLDQLRMPFATTYEHQYSQPASIGWSLRSHHEVI
jgi:hypothetical protein